SMYLGLPLTENDTLNTRFGVSQTSITTFPGSTPTPFIDYLTALNARTFHTWNVELSWAHDTRNKYWNPTRGSLQTVSLEASLPGSTAEYYKLNYRFSQYLPITEKLT